MSNPIPCASSAKPILKCLQLIDEVNKLRTTYPSMWNHDCATVEQLAGQSYDEWADLSTAFSIQKDCLTQVDALHNELLAGCKKIDALLAEIAGWNCQCGPSLEKVRDQLIEHILLSDPDYVRWTITAPIPDA